MNTKAKKRSWLHQCALSQIKNSMIQFEAQNISSNSTQITTLFRKGSQKSHQGKGRLDFTEVGRAVPVMVRSGSGRSSGWDLKVSRKVNGWDKLGLKPIGLVGVGTLEGGRRGRNCKKFEESWATDVQFQILVLPMNTTEYAGRFPIKWTEI